jgi:hypothetical protein
MHETGRDIDIVTLSNKLNESKKIESIGGELYLTELIENPPVASSLNGYAKILIEKMVRRQLIRQSIDMQNKSANEAITIDELIKENKESQSKINVISEASGLSQDLVGSLISFRDTSESVKVFKSHGIIKQGFSPRCEAIQHDWKRFEQHYRPAKATLNTYTGIPSHGKSEFIDSIMLNMTLTHGWKWAVFRPEDYPTERAVQKFAEKLLGKGLFTSMTDVDVDMVMDYIGDKFFIINPTSDNITIEQVKELSDKALDQYGVDGITWDPWNEMQLDVRAYEKETDCIGRNLAFLRRWARRRDFCFNIVAHPTKIQKDFRTKKYPVVTLYDINGSAHWYNKTDNGFSIYRNFDSESGGNDNIDVYIQKVKFKAHGKVGLVNFKYQVVSGRFLELDELGNIPTVNQETMW